MTFSNDTEHSLTVDLAHYYAPGACGNRLHVAAYRERQRAATSDRLALRNRA